MFWAALDMELKIYNNNWNASTKMCRDAWNSVANHFVVQNVLSDMRAPTNTVVTMVGLPYNHI